MQHVCFMFGNTGNEKSAKVTTTMKLKEEFTVFGTQDVFNQMKLPTV